jgi:hypothetical protein
MLTSPASSQRTLKDKVVRKEKDLLGISYEHSKQYVAIEVLTDVNKIPATKR